MFDNMKVAKRIKQARIAGNMTQMNLADAMGVSYQAVSNWERGNSMPDISKLGDLCEALGLTIGELMGAEKPTAVEKVMEEKPLTMEELAEAAPMLPPAAVKSQVEQERKTKKIDLGAIAAIAPFLDEEYLDKLVQDADLEEQAFLHEIAPYLSQETLAALVEKVEPKNLKVFDDVLCYLDSAVIDRLILRCVKAGNYDILKWAAPFASTMGLDAVVEEVEPAELDRLDDLFCFVSTQGADRYLRRCAQAGRWDRLKRAATYASTQGVDALSDLADADSLGQLEDVLCYMSTLGADKYLKRCAEEGRMDGLKHAAPYASTLGLDAVVDVCIAGNSELNLKKLYPYLSDQSLKKLVKYYMEQKDMESLSEIGPYL